MKDLEKVFLVPARVKKMQITNDEEMEAMRKALVWIADMIKEVRGAFRPIIAAANKTWKEALAKEKHYLAPLFEAKEMGAPLMADYLDEKERVRQALLREQAKIEAEAAAKAHKLMEEAMAAEEKGDSEKAGEMMDKMEEVAAVVESTAVAKKEKLDGVHTRTDVLWRLLDLDKVPRSYLMLDERKLNKLAKSMGMAAQVPGVQFYTHTSVVTKVTKVGVKAYRVFK